MKGGTARVFMFFSACLLVGIFSLAASAKTLEGYRDVKLGMTKAQVLEVLQKSPMHFSYEDSGNEVGEIVRGDDLFRYATYKFDKSGALVEIDLQMREVMGRDRCIETYNSQNGMQVSPSKRCATGSITIEVKDNLITMKKKAPNGAGTKSAASREPSS